MVIEPESPLPQKRVAADDDTQESVVSPLGNKENAPVPSKRVRKRRKVVRTKTFMDGKYMRRFYLCFF
jgi:hypothetical protein